MDRLLGRNAFTRGSCTPLMAALWVESGRLMLGRLAGRRSGGGMQSGVGCENTRGVICREPGHLAAHPVVGAELAGYEFQVPVATYDLDVPEGERGGGPAATSRNSFQVHQAPPLVTHLISSGPFLWRSRVMVSSSNGVTSVCFSSRTPSRMTSISSISAIWTAISCLWARRTDCARLPCGSSVRCASCVLSIVVGSHYTKLRVSESLPGLSKMEHLERCRTYVTRCLGPLRATKARCAYP